MKKQISLAAAVALACGGLIYGTLGITDIDAGEVGIVTKKLGQTGISSKTYGTHWIEPIANDVVVMDTRLRKYEMTDIEANTDDGQPILVDVTFETGLVYENVPSLYENVGPDWFEQVVRPAAIAAIRNNTSEKLSDVVYTGAGRADIQAQLTEELSEKLNPLGIRITANLRDIDFTNLDFVATLERKAKAAQEQVIQERLAEAAVQEALKIQNLAEGERFKREQAAQARKYELQAEGEGERLKQEEIAQGILAVGQAQADVIKLKANALIGSGGELYRDIEVLGGLGQSVEFYGVPTGAPGTNSYLIPEALQGRFMLESK